MEVVFIGVFQNVGSDRYQMVHAFLDKTSDPTRYFLTLDGYVFSNWKTGEVQDAIAFLKKELPNFVSAV